MFEKIVDLGIDLCVEYVRGEIDLFSQTSKWTSVLVLKSPFFRVGTKRDLNDEVNGGVDFLQKLLDLGIDLGVEESS